MFNLIAPLLGRLASGGIKTAVVRTRNQFIWWIVVGVSMLITLFFFIFLAYLGLTLVVKPIIAAAILAAFWLIVSIITAMIAKYSAKKKEKDYRVQLNAEENNLLMTAAVTALPLVAKSKKLMALTLPLVAAATLYSSFKKRHAEK